MRPLWISEELFRRVVEIIKSNIFGGLGHPPILPEFFGKHQTHEINRNFSNFNFVQFTSKTCAPNLGFPWNNSNYDRLLRSSLPMLLIIILPKCSIAKVAKWNFLLNKQLDTPKHFTHTASTKFKLNPATPSNNTTQFRVSVGLIQFALHVVRFRRRIKLRASCRVSPHNCVIVIIVITEACSNNGRGGCYLLLKSHRPT